MLSEENKKAFFDVTSKLFLAFQEAGFGNRTKRNPRARKQQEEEENQYQNLSKILKIIYEISEQRHESSAMYASIFLLLFCFLSNLSLFLLFLGIVCMAFL